MSCGDSDTGLDLGETASYWVGFSDWRVVHGDALA